MVILLFLLKKVRSSDPNVKSKQQLPVLLFPFSEGNRLWSSQITCGHSLLPYLGFQEHCCLKETNIVTIRMIFLDSSSILSISYTCTCVRAHTDAYTKTMPTHGLWIYCCRYSRKPTALSNIKLNHHIFLARSCTYEKIFVANGYFFLYILKNGAHFRWLFSSAGPYMQYR